MDISQFVAREGEKPLDYIVPDGGFCKIFRTIGFIGDSLSSGEFESTTTAGDKGYHDFYEYSWGQYIAREAGLKAYNFSKGGMSAKAFCEGFADICGAYKDENICQAYVLALGKREKVGIFGDDYPTADGTCVRDYIHVRDLAKAHLLSLEYLEKGGESGAFNLGSGRGYSVKEIIETARRVTGHPIPAVVEPRRAGDPGVLIASNAKAKAVLGWQPERALEEIVADAWTWHSSRPDGYNK